MPSPYSQQSSDTNVKHKDIRYHIPRPDDTYEVVREPGIKRGSLLDTPYLLWSQGNVQRSDVFLELFDFPATNDRQHVGELMQMVRNSNYKCSSNLGYRRKLQRAKIMDIRAVILSVPTSLAISSREHHTFSSAQAYAPSWDSRLCVPSRHSPCGGLLLHWSGSFRTRVHPREPAQDPLTVPSG